MLAVLFILGMLYPLNFAEIPIALLGNETVFSSVFPDAFLLSLPDCSLYKNMNATVLYTDVSTSETKNETFLIPPCEPIQLGFLLQNLKKGTKYTMWYQIESNTSANLTETTTTVTDYQQINSALQARSGAMVVITVILSLAMVILLVGLIIILFFSG